VPIIPFLFLFKFNGEIQMLDKRKAVGEIMAAMVLMLIASLAGVILFTTSIRASNEEGDYLRSQASDDITAAQERFQIVYARAHEVSGQWYLQTWIQNHGKIDVILDELYIEYDVGPNSYLIRTEFYQWSEAQRLINVGEIKQVPNIPIESGITFVKISIISENGEKDESDWGI
jgi:hypothetical protein